MGSNKTVSTAISRTIHVDFKSKQVVSVDECEYVGSTVRPAFSSTDFIETNFNNDFGNAAGFSSGLQIDPARYIESVIQKFEQVCDDQRLYDQRSYKDPQVLHDAMQTFAILQREIPMLIDTMENLKDMIQSQTGKDPSARAQVGKK